MCHIWHHRWKAVKEVLKFSDIDESNMDWGKELHVLYVDVLTLVQNKGRPGDWTTSAEEGLHRLMGSVIRTLACKLNIFKGFVIPDTIETQDSDDNSVLTLIDVFSQQLFSILQILDVDARDDKKHCIR